MPAHKLKTTPEEYSSPLHIPYIKKIIFSLSTIGAWPYDVMGQKLWFSNYRNSKFLFCFWLVFGSLCAKDLKKNIGVKHFLELGRGYINVLMCFCTLQRISTTWTKLYKDTSKDFINKMHLFYHKDRNEYSMKIYQDVHKISTFFSRLLHVELYWGVFLYNLTPLYNSYRRGMFNAIKPANATYDQPCDFDVPFNYKTNFKGFVVLSIINCFITFDVATSFVSIDLYIFVIVFHLWGHLKILKYNLRHFPRPAMRGDQSNSVTNPPWYSEEESNEIKALLVDSMKHYKIIKEFMDEMSMAFGLIICVYHLFHQIIGCILLLEIAQLKPEAFGTYGILTLTAFQQLIQMSIVFELIASQSETIKDAVYEVPWECMGTKNRKLVLIYLCNIQKPMELKALGILPVGVRTMASILKTSLSYFMLLRTSVDH